MIQDVLTVARKEWLEIIDQLLRFKRGGWSILLVVLFLGVISPLQMGTTWLSSPLMFFYWPLLTSSMTSTLIADSIAGERERHTLETLLASRLPDAAIISGKILAAVLNRPGAPPETAPLARDFRAEFDARFILVTATNIEPVMNFLPNLF